MKQQVEYRSPAITSAATHTETAGSPDNPPVVADNCSTTAVPTPSHSWLGPYTLSRIVKLSGGDE